MGWAYASTLAEGEAFTTVELKISFLRAVRQATLTAEAKASSTCLKLRNPPHRPAGRDACTSQSTTLPSPPPEASDLPSGLKASE
jgi:hypothetical protein